MKRLSAVTILILLAVSVGATFTASAATNQTDRRRHHPTTTTQRHTTTTERAHTTTTARPTTTTARPTTTTTLATPTGDRYDFFVLIDGVGRIWTAPYFYDLPYTPNTGWADGNRDGYDCMYGPLLWNGNPVGRFTITRIDEAAAYTKINDEGMPENSDTNRHWDTGLLTPTPVRQGECPPPTETYEPSTAPGQFPVIDFIGSHGQLLERRDYRNVSADGRGAPLDPRLKFRLIEATSQKATVMAYWDNQPIAPIYYEAPYGGGVTVNGYLP